jgi:hypothetical protein
MIRVLRFSSRVALLSLALGSFAFGEVLFTNGPDPGHVGGDFLSSYGGSSQEFDLTSESILTSLTISTWTDGGGPSTLNWEISTNSPSSGFGTDEGSGSSAAANVFDTFHSFNIYYTTASLPSIDLPAGDYWLTLTSDNSSDGSTVYWGLNGTPTLGFETNNGGWVNQGGSYNGILELDGSVSSATPEPGTLSLLGLSLAGAAVRLRRRTV